ncbi:MBL fold metallo-hydrolase [Kitasatospora sp. MMS16-BH015]|uniref:MBL fold metallo-hydrolase n=1 Tax=Kitasatospora sp. MMS16-BH015 TaxID=2018025 RepID=UPI000CA3A378|nr:MBL fold metallo-hydrolase [Kitasatospora sp. MMS16-BH015]AUG75176.1 MBL fold metallo-hydrolase [Kitasatospora sp. MMS16-BH015]
MSAHPAAPSWSLGDLRIHRIDEITLPAETGSWLLPEATPALLAELPWLRPDFTEADAPLLVSHSFAVEADGLRILIDTGIGNGKTRANPAWHGLETDFTDRLTAAGFAPDTVDLVVTTHLHTDHVGWNTRLLEGHWEPTFPNARYLTARTEWDHWAATELDPARQQMFDDSVHPVRDSGQLDLVDLPESTGTTRRGVEIAPGVHLRPAPGHTPGQLAVELRGSARSALITGDSIHHPVQLAHPQLTSCVDLDPAQAVRTRAHLLAELADTDTLLLGTHFPHPTGGLVRTDTTGRYRLHPEPPTKTTP